MGDDEYTEYEAPPSDYGELFIGRPSGNLVRITAEDWETVLAVLDLIITTPGGLWHHQGDLSPIGRADLRAWCAMRDRQAEEK